VSDQLGLFDDVDEALKEYPPESRKLFRKYNLERPELYPMFERYALEMRSGGRTHYGAQGIVERMRWDFSMKYPDVDFKINNNFRTMLGRIVMHRHPELLGFFEKRRVTGIHPVSKDDVVRTNEEDDDDEWD
jgi:hypothetical protein